jgi:hypothetical protein
LADSNPLWNRKWLQRITEEIVKRPNTRFSTVPNLLKQAMFELENVICKSPDKIQKELKFTFQLSKHPNDYKNNTKFVVVGKLLEKDKGEEVHYYETNDEDEHTKVIVHPIYQHLEILTFINTKACCLTN